MGMFDTSNCRINAPTTKQYSHAGSSVCNHGSTSSHSRFTSTSDDLISNRIIEDIFRHNQLMYINQSSPDTYFYKQKDDRTLPFMPTISEETKYDVEQESNLAPHIPLHRIATAAAIAMSIVNKETTTKLITSSNAAVVDHITILLHHGNEREKELAACALHRLATHKENRSIIAERGSISPLLDIIRNGTSYQEDQALAAIATLIVHNDKNKVMIARADGISPLLRIVRNGTEMQQSLAVRALYCLAKNENIRDEVFRKGGISPIADLTVKYETTPDLRRSAIATLKLLSTNKR